MQNGVGGRPVFVLGLNLNAIRLSLPLSVGAERRWEAYRLASSYLRGRGPPPFVTGLGSPGRGVSLGKYAMPQQVGEPQDPDPSVGPTFVAPNWFYPTIMRPRAGSDGELVSR
jgi:hypothetical protein